MFLWKYLTQRRGGTETQKEKWGKRDNVFIHGARSCSGRFLNKFIFGFLCFCLLVLGAACEGEVPTPPPIITPTEPPSVLRIGLTDSASEMMVLTAAPFEAAYPQMAIQYVTANNHTLLADLGTGQLDAVLVHYLPPTSDDWFNPVALDGLVIIVHPDNVVTELSTAEIQAIFNGQITNWSSLGESDMAIEVISREQGAGSRRIFSERVMLERRITITAQIVTDNSQMIEVVAANPGAVGYSMMGAVGDSVQNLAVDGIAANPMTTADQSYPLTTPLYFVSTAEPTGALRNFLAWLQGEDGQMVIGEKYGRVR